ncbi:MAG: hypothetical protein KA004_14760 [Verrucomicrobiales bacterium]|nr:hypothetical protein [Verrucomicrobiales bacterium]
MRACTRLIAMRSAFVLIITVPVAGETVAELERHQYGIYESSLALKLKATPEFLRNLGDDDTWLKDAVRGLLFSGYLLSHPEDMPPGYRAIFDEMEWRGDRLLPFYLALLEDPKDVLLRQNLLGHFWDVPTLDTEPFINHIRKLVDTGALEHAELGLSSVCAGILLGLGQKEDVVRVKRLGYDEQGHFVNEMRQRLEQEYHGKETPVSARKRKKEQRIAELQRQRTANDRPTMSAVSKGVPPVRTDSSATDPSGILLYLGVGLLVLAALQAVLKVLWR